jgi:hypothetical protein
MEDLPMDEQMPDIPEAEHVTYSKRERATRAFQMASGLRCSLCGTLSMTLPDGNYTECLCTPEDEADYDAWMKQPQPRDERRLIAQFVWPLAEVDRKGLVRLVRSSARHERLRLAWSRKDSAADQARRQARIYNLTDLADDIAEQRIGLREGVAAYRQISGSTRPIFVFKPELW